MPFNARQFLESMRAMSGAASDNAGMMKAQDEANAPNNADIQITKKRDGSMKVTMGADERTINSLFGRLGGANTPNGGQVSTPGSPQSFPNPQAYMRQQAGEAMIGARPENPNEVPMKQRFLNALQDMGNYQFDPRAGWGNVVNALGAGARGAAGREEQYQNSMKWYTSQLANIQDQLQKNEIDMETARERMKIVKAQGQQLEASTAQEMKMIPWEQASATWDTPEEKEYALKTANAYGYVDNIGGRPVISASNRERLDKLMNDDNVILDKLQVRYAGYGNKWDEEYAKGDKADPAKLKLYEDGMNKTAEQIGVIKTGKDPIAVEAAKGARQRENQILIGSIKSRQIREKAEATFDVIRRKKEMDDLGTTKGMTRIQIEKEQRALRAQVGSLMAQVNNFLSDMSDEDKVVVRGLIEDAQSQIADYDALLATMPNPIVPLEPAGNPAPVTVKGVPSNGQAPPANTERRARVAKENPGLTAEQLKELYKKIGI